MRTAKPKTKVKTDVPIPDRLRAFLVEVSARIEAGDDSTKTESDDLLQCEYCYGGLSDPARGIFSFTFFPGEGTRRKWIFELSTPDIAAVSANSQRSLTLWGCPDPGCGAMFFGPDRLCFYCDYVDDARDARALPQGAHATRREWALAYYSLHPEVHPMMMIGDFNGKTDLGKTLGRFSLDEATALKSEAVSNG